MDDRGLVVAMPFLIGWHTRDPDLALQPKSRIWVNGTSNVRNFECKAAKIDVTVETNGPNAVHAVAAGDKAVGKVDLTVPVGTMDCGNGTMNGHMNEALKEKDHPEIEFRLVSYALVKAADSVARHTQRNAEHRRHDKTVTIAAERKDAADGVLRVTGEYELHMKDFGIKPPTLMLGTMRVR